jgi:putative ABC transport system permease protein
MTHTPAWRRYLRFWRSNIDADVDDELRFHTQMRVAEYMARGMSEADARRAVAERLGDVDAARAECIEQGRLREVHARNADFVDGLRSDLRYGLRSLGRAPAWTAVALLTIALGVGATTTVFRVADMLLLRPIHYPNASRIFIARRAMMIGGARAYAPIPVAALSEWRSHAHTIEAAEPFRSLGFDFGDSTDATSISASMIDTAFLAFAGAHPIIGRNFVAAETAPGGPRAVLLSESFWRRQYGASSDVIGKIARLDGQPFTIVGVLPSSLAIPQFRIEPADVWLPLVVQNAPFVNGIIVRLRPGLSPDAATAELDTLFQRAKLGEPHGLPRGLAAPRMMPMRLVLTRPEEDLKNRQSLVMLVCAVGLLLLVACSNVAHLLLARGASRQRELAVRHALGAARSRLVRQLVTESLLIAALGAVLAVAVGWIGLVIFSSIRPADMVAMAYVSTGRGVLTIASALAIGGGLTIGVLAALRTAGRNIGVSLRSGGIATTLRAAKLRTALVIGEVALSATLLVGALLLTHAVVALQHIRVGFDARGLYGLIFQMRRGSTPAEHAAFAAEIQNRAVQIPGIEGAALAGAAPQPHYWRMLTALETPERAASEANTEGTATNSVSPDYFAMMRMPLLAGHTFDDGSAERNEAIVSLSLARQLWPNESPLGRRFRNGLPAPDGSHEPWKTVIGVVPDMVQDLLEGPGREAIYAPLVAADPPSFAGNSFTLLVRLRSGVPPSAVDRLAAAIAPGSSRPVIMNVRESIDKSMAEPRFFMQVLATFAALGVLLAAIGLFGVISYTVGQRTREIGIRMTLGATRTSIARLVISDGLRLAVIGIALGLLGATAATRLIQSSLYGVSRLDPLSFALGAVVLLFVAVGACAAPMWRATAVDPVIAVRAD